MKKAKKILTLVACAVLLVCLSVGATLAYLQSQDAVTNTFTVGKVGINLDEAAVKKNDDGDYEKDGDKREEVGNDYHLLPGVTAVKDPTITVDSQIVGEGEDARETIENCYVVAKIVVSAANMGTVTDGVAEEGSLRALLGYKDSNGLIGFEGIVTGGVFNNEYVFSVEDGVATWTHDDVVLTQEVVDDTNVFYVYYTGEKKAADKMVLFEQIAIPETWDNDELVALDGLNMEISAYAIQAEGFNDVFTAFAAGNWN